MARFQWSLFVHHPDREKRFRVRYSDTIISGHRRRSLPTLDYLIWSFWKYYDGITIYDIVWQRSIKWSSKQCLCMSHWYGECEQEKGECHQEHALLLGVGPKHGHEGDTSPVEGSNEVAEHSSDANHERVELEQLLRTSWPQCTAHVSQKCF